MSQAQLSARGHDHEQDEQKLPPLEVPNPVWRTGVDRTRDSRSDGGNEASGVGHPGGC